MSRVALASKKVIIAAVVIVAAAVGGGTWAYVANQTSPSQTKAASTTQQQAKTKPITEISYQGQDGKDALALLKKHATITTKHYSFGDQVVSINGVTGNGPKYWTFYINGKMANEGAGSYVTKNSDKLMWRLQ